jgi:dipeptidyl aminopeptidase/acylaminoacyl peptidase
MISPDQNFLLYSVTSVDYEKNTFQSELKIIDLRSGKTHKLIANASDYQWSPDGGKISFVGDFGEGYGIHTSSLTFRDGKLSTSPTFLAPIHSSSHFLGHPTSKNYSWSFDGNYIAYVSADPSTCQVQEDPNDPIVIDRLLYKSRTGMSDNCRTRIYMVQSSGGKAVALTSDQYDSHSVSWGEESKTVLFVSNRTSDPDNNYNNDLWKMNISSREIQRITHSPGTEHHAISNDRNEWLAFPATLKPINTKDSPAENTHIYFMKNDGKDREAATMMLDQRASDPKWDTKGRWLYFKIQENGKIALYRTRRGKTPESVVNLDAWVGGYSVGEDHVYLTLTRPGQPGEIYQVRHDGSDLSRISQETAAWSQSKSFASTEEFWYESFDGIRVQGFITHPKNVDSGMKIPVIHSIHGGPHGMYGYYFNHFNELMAANGMAVVFINPRGSTGYGQSFANGTIKAWGGGDYQDLMLGMDAALEKYSFLDEERMIVTGGSYGGFMTNWIVTQTDRYKGAISIASVSNLISFYGTSLYQLLIETEFEGMPWDDYDLLWEYSPMKYIANTKTPTLLIHGENDMDVPITQAEEFYIGLKKVGVPARLIRYPNEGHGIYQPVHKEHYYSEIFGWINRCLTSP